MITKKNKITIAIISGLVFLGCLAYAYYSYFQPEKNNQNLNARVNLNTNAGVNLNINNTNTNVNADTSNTNSQNSNVSLNTNQKIIGNLNYNNNTNTKSAGNTNSPITLYPLGELISDLADNRLKAGIFTTYGTIVSYRHCPPCPEGSLCAECQPDAILVGDSLSSSKTIAFITINPEMYPKGTQAIFTINISLPGVEPYLLMVGQT